MGARRALALCLAVGASIGCGLAIGLGDLQRVGAEPSADASVLSDDAGGGGADGTAPPNVDGSARDAAADARADAPASDARVDARASGIQCGASTCTAGAQRCCASSGSRTCAPADAGCTTGVPVACDDEADCVAVGLPGNVCCLRFDSQGSPSRVACETASSCSNAQDSTRLCDPGAATCACTEQSFGYPSCL